MSPLTRTTLDRRMGYRLHEAFIDETVTSGHHSNEYGHNSAEPCFLHIRHSVSVVQGLTNLDQDVDPNIVTVTSNLSCRFISGIVFVRQEKSNVLSGIPSCCEQLDLRLQVTEKYTFQLAILLRERGETS